MGKGLKRDIALKLAEISKDQFYYQPKNKKGGYKKSLTTMKYLSSGRWEFQSNQSVVKDILQQKKKQDLDYGYRKMTFFLQQKGYKINHKKVYRLMKENDLLKVKLKQSNKKHVKYRIVVPEGPLEVLEMDIKQVWVEEYKRYAYILTILDTFTRSALYFSVGYQMRQTQVQAAWEYVIEQYLQPADTLNRELHIEVRNDNGPQFSAKAVQDFFIENHLHQVFTHPYTPQENGHIESFHGILAKHLKPITFWTLKQLEEDLTLFYEKYNNERIHASIAYLPPNIFWQLWEQDYIERIELDKKRVRFKLKLHYYEIKETIGLYEPEGSCSLQAEGLNALEA